jgi:hypothetical protein
MTPISKNQIFFVVLATCLPILLLGWLFAQTALPVVAVSLVDTCFVSVNNSGTTDYSSADASALQATVNAANPGDTLKVAGTA